MKREIKFRAWDGKGMSDPFTLGTVTIRWRYRDGELRHSCPNKQFQHVDVFPVMQFTGLKDNNGVEIYEGDIVRSGVEDASTERWVVQFDPCAGYISPGGMAFDNKWVNHYIIGNIYQNPELLEATK